jgi:membrane associated rhomboid family serine protease
MNNSPLRRTFNYTYSNAVLILIFINIAVFFITSFKYELIVYLSMTPALVLYNKMIWQFVSYMFVHYGFQHLFLNMLGLFFFGAAVERRMGSREFVLFYLLTGILAGIFSFVVYYFTGNLTVHLLGASGAVYAVLLAFAVFNPEAKIYVFYVLPVRAPWLVVIYTVIGLAGQITGRGGNVAHLTHLAGFAFAYLYILIRLGIDPARALFGSRRY